MPWTVSFFRNTLGTHIRNDVLDSRPDPRLCLSLCRAKETYCKETYYRAKETYSHLMKCSITTPVPELIKEIQDSVQRMDEELKVKQKRPSIVSKET